LAGTEFQAEKLNVTFVNPKSKVGLLTGAERIAIEKKHLDNKDLLKIPRRPKWTATMTADELKLLENESFLTWRRNLAQLQDQDGMLLTPYEKNLDFWRQLWRVVERSDVVVQIVDARNPLVFRSEDLEKYVKEVDPNKQNMILLNKSDFLNDDQRRHWAEYFDKEGMRVIFFSALEPEESELEPVEEDEEDISEESSSDDEDEEVETGTLKLDEIKAEIKSLESKLSKSEEKLEVVEAILSRSTEQLAATSHDPAKNNPNVLTRAELIAYFKGLHSGLVTIGFCGYPNVGKSSTINTLLKEKKVSVSSTPGKTKHFQTLYLDPELLLCDCPGLVMPTFCTTKADMVLNGILPIDQMRDQVPPINMLCTLIPRHVLEAKYGIMIAKPLDGEDPNRPPHSEEFLLAYSCKHFHFLMSEF
jgi:large subunit GTPase 1